MKNIILGNVFSLCANLSDAISSTRKTKKGILVTQSISQFFYIGSALALRAYSTAAQNVVSIFRNIYSAYDKDNKIINWLLVILPVVLGVYFNNQGLLGLVPVAANLEYSLALIFFAKNPISVKIAFFICMFAFVFFNFCILNYVGAIACIAVVVTTAISIIKSFSAKKD